MIFRPEGNIYDTAMNRYYISSYEGLAEAMENSAVIEARVSMCNSSHDLIVDLPCGRGIIPREEGAMGIAEGTTRDIALISRVKKPVWISISPS